MAIEPQSASVDSSESGAIIIDVVYSQKATIGLAATCASSTIMVNHNIEPFSAISSPIGPSPLFLFL